MMMFYLIAQRSHVYVCVYLGGAYALMAQHGLYGA